MTKRLLNLLIVLAGGSVLLLAAGCAAPGAGAAGPAPTVPPVQTSKNVTAEGKLVPQRSVTLGFPASGVIGEVLVQEGDQVRAGQVIARLRSEHQAAGLAQAQAALQRAEAQRDGQKAGIQPYEVTAGQAQLDLIEVLLDRLNKDAQPDEIAASKDALASAERAQSERVASGTRPEELRAAEAAVAMAEADVAQAQAALRDAELLAPFAGTLVTLDARVGEEVAAGAPLARLADLAAWKVETINLTETRVSRIRTGGTARLAFDAVPGLELRGVVTGIRGLGETRQGDTVYTVTVAPDGSDPRLRWNMTAQVIFDQ